MVKKKRKKIIREIMVTSRSSQSTLARKKNSNNPLTPSFEKDFKNIEFREF